MSVRLVQVSRAIVKLVLRAIFAEWLDKITSFRSKEYVITCFINIQKRLLDCYSVIRFHAFTFDGRTWQPVFQHIQNFL